jgi:hypothetical protein
MPIPTPKKGENQKAFVSRCMSTKAMIQEFSDKKQRAAVCYQKWRDRKKESKS